MKVILVTKREKIKLLFSVSTARIKCISKRPISPALNSTTTSRSNYIYVRAISCSDFEYYLEDRWLQAGKDFMLDLSAQLNREVIIDRIIRNDFTTNCLS